MQLFVHTFSGHVLNQRMGFGDEKSASTLLVNARGHLRAAGRVVSILLGILGNNALNNRTQLVCQSRVSKTVGFVGHYRGGLTHHEHRKGFSHPSNSYLWARSTAAVSRPLMRVFAGLPRKRSWHAIFAPCQSTEFLRHCSPLWRSAILC